MPHLVVAEQRSNMRLLILFGSLVCWAGSAAAWPCSADSECGVLAGSVCRGGECACPPGRELDARGTACVPVAPYHTSPCVDDHQCWRLLAMFQCAREHQTDEAGECRCQAGHHYVAGRCWPAADFGAPCSADQQCITVPRDPFALSCESGRCVCAPGYYERQRGDCRKIGHAVGDGCVLDGDCQFNNGACDIATFTCIDSTAPPTQARVPEEVLPTSSAIHLNLSRSAPAHELACDSAPCPEPFQCESGVCVCPRGYYLSDNGAACNAELGSPSSAEQCVGLLAEVRDGRCLCPANFFYDHNMRDCVKVTRRITDACVWDENCHTFGAAARCGPAREPWGLRQCECDPGVSVWDEARQMCRLFVGVGEQCEADSDCLAGELEIQCVSGVCTCPAGLTQLDGLCLSTGLALGDACQASAECTATAHMECEAGRCACAAGYRPQDDYCAPVVGGSCTSDTDCAIADTECVPSEAGTLSLARLLRDTQREDKVCRCRAGYVAHNDECWTVSLGFENPCNVSSQCVATLGESSECAEDACRCLPGFHHRDDRCWPIVGLFEACSRSSECYLQGLSERTECRNGACQCVFEHPYNEERHTCGDGIPRDAADSATAAVPVFFLLALSCFTVYL